jgi:hypothetical protein
MGSISSAFEKTAANGKKYSSATYSRLLAATSNKYNFSQLFHLNREGNGNDDISSEVHFKNSKTKGGSYLITRTVHFCPNI